MADGQGGSRQLPAWREMNQDTSPEVEEMLFAYWRDAPAWEKWQRMVELNRSARFLALAGLRRRHPQASEAELRWRLVELLLGPELTERTCGGFESFSLRTSGVTSPGTCATSVTWSSNRAGLLEL